MWIAQNSTPMLPVKSSTMSFAKRLRKRWRIPNREGPRRVQRKEFLHRAKTPKGMVRESPATVDTDLPWTPWVHAGGAPSWHRFDASSGTWSGLVKISKRLTAVRTTCR